MTWRWGSSPKCWKTIENRRRRSSRSRAGLGLADVLAVEAGPRRRSARSGGSGSAPAWTCRCPDRPITTKTSPGLTSNETSRTAIVPPSAATAARWRGVRSASGVPTTLSSAGPKTFHRSRTGQPAGCPLGRRLRHRRADPPYDPRWPPERQPPNQPVGPGAVFCQMCLASRYSSRPLGPSSRPMPDCLKPPHSACGRYVL